MSYTMSRRSPPTTATVMRTRSHSRHPAGSAATCVSGQDLSLGLAVDDLSDEQDIWSPLRIAHLALRHQTLKGLKRSANHSGRSA